MQPDTDIIDAIIRYGRPYLPIDRLDPAAVAELVSSGHVELWPECDKGPAITLTSATASARGVKIVMRRRRKKEWSQWLPLDTPDDPPFPARNGKTVTKTDLDLKSWDDLPRTWGPGPSGLHDDDGSTKPTLLIEGCGPWIAMRVPCPACKGELRAPGHYCLRCDKWWPRAKSARAKTTTKAG